MAVDSLHFLRACRLVKRALMRRRRGGRNSSYFTSVMVLRLPQRLGSKRRKREADSENDREPDQPHGHLGGDGWRESNKDGGCNSAAGLVKWISAQTSYGRGCSSHLRRLHSGLHRPSWPRATPHSGRGARPTREA